MGQLFLPVASRQETQGTVVGPAVGRDVDPGDSSAKVWKPMAAAKAVAASEEKISAPMSAMIPRNESRATVGADLSEGDAEGDRAGRLLMVLPGSPTTALWPILTLPAAGDGASPSLLPPSAMCPRLPGVDDAAAVVTPREVMDTEHWSRPSSNTPQVLVALEGSNSPSSALGHGPRTC